MHQDSFFRTVTRYDTLMEQLDRNIFDLMDKGKQNEIIQKARLLMNDLIQSATGAVSEPDMRAKYIKEYNKIARVIGEKFVTDKVVETDKRKIDEAKADFVDKISEGRDLSIQSLQQKLYFYDSVLKMKSPSDLFAPRVVLFQTGTFWTKEDQQTIKIKYLETKKAIKSEVDKMFDVDGQTKNETVKNVHKILSEHYPTGKVPVPRRIKDKTTGEEKIVYSSMPLNSYASTWVSDLQVMNASKAAVSAVRNSGCDLIKVAGGVTDNKICDPYSTPPAIYSITGETKGYPILDKFPPYHPNCSKYLTYTSDMNKLEN